MGGGTALFVCGTCYAPGRRIAALSLVVDGDLQPLMGSAMPRLDSLRTTGDPAAYRSGFWGLARVRPRPDTAVCAVELRARLSTGEHVVADVGRIPLAAPPAPLPGAPRVAVCMATFDPPLGLFARQVESLRAQTERDWLCIVSDDGSSAEASTAMRTILNGDPRFVLTRSDRRLGFYRNFERALGLVPANASYVALADQDDTWHPDKLATLLAEIGAAPLAYSDARLVGRDGTVLADTYWSRRRPNHSDPTSLLVANAVTGAASLFPRRLLDDALPFPPAQFAHFHDHWIALCAMAQGEIRFVERPLYDYVQHGGAALGHAAANQMPSMLERLGGLRREPRERIRLWRLHYFVDACRLQQLAGVLLLRLGTRMPAGKRGALERFVAAENSLRPLVGLGWRGACELLSPRATETLGAEWMLLHAFAWRRLLDATARDDPNRRLRLDAVPPPVLDPRPDTRIAGEPALRVLAEKITPLRIVVADAAPPRVNLLIPAFDLPHFFGGYIGKLNLALRLARAGRRVRIVTVDPVGSLAVDWRRRVESYSGLAGLFAQVEVSFGREAASLEASPDDAFIATTWWTAHVASQALDTVRAERFLYLIQEYEPFTFPMGSHAALAAESYGFPHTALFSTELLREYFRRHRLGVYASGPEDGDRASATFRNAITAVRASDAAVLRERRPRRLLFYARPEGHAARNMYELGALALSRALDRGAFADGWTLHAIGAVDGARRIDLGGSQVELLPRSPQDDYAALLARHDVGLGLMYTPHPSLVPIEMAAAGLLTVTNTFENKTEAALTAISSNLIAAQPSIDAVAEALCEASAGAGDVERRIRGSDVAWPRDWDAAFDPELLARITRLLGA